MLLGDLVSLYLAVLRGVDPATIVALDRLKGALAEIGSTRWTGAAGRGSSPNLDTIVVGLGGMEALTINEAAGTTGWSPRMLRYVEQAGLVAPARSASGYRLYGAAQLQRLRTLKELLARFEIGLSDVAFAARMASDTELRDAVQRWLESQASRPARTSTPRTGCASSRTSTRGCSRPSPDATGAARGRDCPTKPQGALENT